MDDEKIQKTLIKAGMKEIDANFLIKAARKRNISVSKMFYFYAWKYYAWGCALLLAVIFSSINRDIDYLISTLVFWSAMACVSLLFTPFFKNLIWSIKIQIFLWGK